MIHWCIYNRPKDYPQNVVARKWLVKESKILPTNDVELFDTINAARMQMRLKGLVKIPRNEYDDPVILETWI